ncbi:MAG: 16S rRNA processing protein RimM [Candidatus Riflebacteria bacterium HGW-Riflebacteria-1]|jgi:16S rRNA processing protein RimM|nr:MAG: 16S rRNA processing protein RimM [Candidatus Riflebacteria bacterium HGW-Riflebacteria-1]
MPQSRILRLNKSESSPEEDSLIVIGKVRRTVGLRGWVRVGLNTDYPERFSPGSQVLVKRLTGEPEPVEIEDWREHFSGDAIEIKFVGADDCDAAATFVNTLLVIPKSEREQLSSGTEFYPDELSGMQVVSPEGKVSGVVITLEAEVANPYLVVKTNNGSEVMIPFLKVFIGSVDRKARQVKLVEPLTFHFPVE